MAEQRVPGLDDHLDNYGTPGIEPEHPVNRFRIYRLPNTSGGGGPLSWALWPWVLRDRKHPERFERFASHREAVDAADALTKGEPA